MISVRAVHQKLVLSQKWVLQTLIYTIKVSLVQWSKERRPLTSGIFDIMVVSLFRDLLEGVFSNIRVEDLSQVQRKWVDKNQRAGKATNDRWDGQTKYLAMTRGFLHNTRKFSYKSRAIFLVLCFTQKWRRKGSQTMLLKMTFSTITKIPVCSHFSTAKAVTHEFEWPAVEPQTSRMQGIWNTNWI